MSPVLGGQIGVGERAPDLFCGCFDVGDVDVCGDGSWLIGHGFLLCLGLDRSEGVEAGCVEASDPSLADLVDWCGVEVVEAFSASANDGDEVGAFEHVEMLGCGLACHVEVFAQFAQRLPVAFAETIEQKAPSGIGQRLENHVDVRASILH